MQHVNLMAVEFQQIFLIYYTASVIVGPKRLTTLYLH
jgi:hypothetical protein